MPRSALRQHHHQPLPLAGCTAAVPPAAAQPAGVVSDRLKPGSSLQRLLRNVERVEGDPGSLFLCCDDETIRVAPSPGAGLSKEAVRTLAQSMALELTTDADAFLHMFGGVSAAFMKRKVGNAVFLSAEDFSAMCRDLVALKDRRPVEIFTLLPTLGCHAPANAASAAGVRRPAAAAATAGAEAEAQLRPAAAAAAARDCGAGEALLVPDVPMSKVNQICATTAAVVTGLLLASGHGQKRPAYDTLAMRPLAAQELELTFERLRRGDKFATVSCARMFEALQTCPERADDVLSGVHVLVRENALGAPEDLLGGIWVAAAAVVLSVPPVALRGLVLPRPLVQKLSVMRSIVLGQVHNIGTKGGAHPEFSKVVAGGRQADLPEVFFKLSDALEKTATGKPLARRFDQALAILWHNAERFDAFLGMPEFERPENLGRKLIDLLDEFVPELPGGGRHPAVAMQALPLSTRADSDAFATAAPRVHAVGHAEQAGDAQKAQKTEHAEGAQHAVHVEAVVPDVPDVEGASVHAPFDDARDAQPGSRAPAHAVPVAAACAQLPQHLPPRPPLHPDKQPGSQPPQQPQHNHAKNRRALPKADAQLQLDKYQFVVAGLLHPYATLTRELKEQLQQMHREERLLRNQGSTEVKGQQLVRVDYLDT